MWDERLIPRHTVPGELAVLQQLAYLCRGVCRVHERSQGFWPDFAPGRAVCGQRLQLCASTRHCAPQLVTGGGGMVHCGVRGGIRVVAYQVQRPILASGSGQRALAPRRCIDGLHLELDSCWL